VTRDEVLAELADDVRAVLGDRKVRTHDDKTKAIVALVADLLAPGALAAVEVVGARIGVEHVELGNAGVEVDANGDLSRIELDAAVELEWHERQE
jgi:hypothetical protein